MGPGAVSRVALVIEDHAATRQALCTLLERAGVECLATGTVAGAISLLSHRPACVVLDLLLPDGVGLDVMIAIRRMGLATRIIVSTGAADPELLDAVYALEPEVLLEKPHSATLLLDLVHESIHAARCG